MIQEDYNSSRDKLLFPEYGRHIQNMVKQLSKIEDIEERTRQAHIVIDVMGNLNNNLRDADDFKHKLWDHLFILSDFQLDVHSPYEIPTHEELFPQPQKMEYPGGSVGYKQYGVNIRKVIAAIRDEQESDLKDSLVLDIVKFMKFKSYEYNQEYPSDRVVVNHFKSFYKNDIELDEEVLSSTRVNIKKRPIATHRRESVKGSFRVSSPHGTQQNSYRSNASGGYHSNSNNNNSHGSNHNKPRYQQASTSNMTPPSGSPHKRHFRHSEKSTTHK